MIKKILPILTLILLISLFISGCGDDGSVSFVNTPSVIPTPGTNLSTINGTVYNSNGTPASGAAVTLTPNISSSEAYGEVQTATTGIDGKFYFTVSYGGTYFVEAKEGTVLLGSQEFTLSLGSTITLVLGQASTGTLRIQLTPAGAVAAVTVNGINSSSDEISSAQSAAGEYIFYIPGGTYSFTVNAAGYNSVTLTDVVVNVGKETLKTVDLTAEEIDIGTLTKLEPRVIVNANLTTQEIKVTGSNFTGNGTDNNITITLISVSDGTSIPISGITVDDPNTVRFTADFAGAASGEYALTLTHRPITSSSSTETSNVWLMDTIQGAIDKAGNIYALENASGKMTASSEDPGWIQAYIPAGTYELLPGSAIPSAISSEDMLGLSSGVYIKGAGGDAAGGTHIVASGGRRHFQGLYNYDIALDDLRLTGGNASTRGGVLYADCIKGEWLITNCVMTGNTATGSGGAIYIYGESYKPASVTITDNTFTQNSGGEGGAVYIYAREYTTWNVTITGNTINQNSSTGNGGGVHLQSDYAGGEYTINNNTITDNFCNSSNGAGLSLWIECGYAASPFHAVVQNNTITGNYATGPGSNDYGGGIYCYLEDVSSADITGNTISNNGNYGGGGLYLELGDGSTTNVSGNKITGNAAIQQGGGIQGNNYEGSSNASLTVIDNEISGNGTEKTIGTQFYTETVTGGGIYVDNLSKCYINRNNIYNNTGTSANGAQLYYDATSPVLDATNNWWGSGVNPENNSVVHNYTGGYVTVSPYAGSQFTVPVTP